jgi:Skp family chaperone for outer membrane proteins
VLKLRGKIFLRFVLFMLATFSLASLASAAPNKKTDSQVVLKIAILDMNHLIETSKASLNLRNKMDEDRVKIQEHIKTLEDELRAKEKDLIEGQASARPDVIQSRKSALEKEFEQVQEMVSEEKMQLSKNFEEGMIQIQSSIASIVDKIVAERGYTLILPKSMVIHNANSMDVTTEVLEKLNEDLPSTVYVAAPKSKEGAE